MTDVPDEVQRWTAKRKAAVVLSIVKGETSAAEAARKHGKGGYWLAWLLPYAVRLALAAGDRALAERLADSLGPRLQPLADHATVAVQALVREARGEYEAATAGFADAASLWHDFGVPYEEGQALLGQGRCLVALGREGEAAAPLRAAREIFARLGAKPALVEVDRLLDDVSTAPR